jgi:geranylgeranyl diphosphate synthase type II
VPLLLRELSRYKGAVMGEIERVFARRAFRPTMRELLLEYPLREGKGLRPALCLATCEACGGRMEHALTSAAALELFHNAFLAHDDVEDESLSRRGQGTLVEKYGRAVAVNVGDALNVLSAGCLLDNTGVIGLEKSLRLFHETERMARESVDGQALELDWVRHARWSITPRDYFMMTYKKTCWYTCIAPCRMGAIVAGVTGAPLEDLRRFGYFMGIAFQIQDDVLNLTGDEGRYGKERCGDIWEGKRTLALIHLLRNATPAEHRAVTAFLRLPRAAKSQAGVDEVEAMMLRHGSIGHAREVSRRLARKAREVLDRRTGWMPESRHKRFLRATVDYVITRDL